MKHSLSSAWGFDSSGQVAIVFAILVFPIFLIVGLNLDVARYVSANKKVQIAVDAAALSGARAMADASLSDDDIKAFAVSAFAENYSPGGDGATCGETVATVDRTNETVDVSVTCVVAQLFGLFDSTQRQLQFERTSQTEISLTSMDVALMLDTSGSMAGDRLTALQTGAKSLVSTLITEDSGNRVRISIVPYGDAVNAGVYGNRAQGKTDDDDSDGDDTVAADDTDGTSDADDTDGTDEPDNDGMIVCVSRRTAPDSEYTDDAPSESNYVGDEVGANCWDPLIVPLSHDADRLNSAIDGLTANGFSTAGHIGMEWSWYTISSNWSSVWPTASAPIDNSNPSSVKAVILMTDGIFNSHYDFPQTAKRKKSARDLKQLCTNMLAEGILIYVVGFDIVTSTRTEYNADWYDRYRPQVLLPHCAGSASRFLQPADNDELIAVYKSIAELLKIEAVVVTN